MGVVRLPIVALLLNLTVVRRGTPRGVDATLDQILAAGLIKHSTSPYSSPLVVIPKKSGGVWITLNYKKLNQISKLS